MKTCTERFNLVDPILKRFFRWLGARIGERPGYFLIVPVFITLLAVTGFQRIHTESRPEKLFALKSGRAQQALNLVQQLFPINDTAFDYTRRHDLNNLIRIQISSKDGGSLLTSAALAEVAQLDDLVRNTVLVTDVKGEWRYEDLCASWEGKCEQNEAMRLTPMASDLEAGVVNLSYPVHLVDIWSDVPAILLPKTLGSPIVNNDSVVVSAPALALSYYTGRYVYYGVDVSRQWENEVLKHLLAIQPNLNHTIISFYLSQTLGEELDHNVYSVIPYMSVNYVLMGTFCVLACLMRDWVRGKPVVVLSGLLGAAMAVGTAFGILMYAGVPFIGINIAAPFLMLGIGVDDTFVVLSAWWRTRLHDPVPKRMAEAYEEAAVSITITSLTDMFSFWVGVATPIPSVQIFCLYTGLSVVFTYLWHIFFFGACLALSGYAEQKNLHSVTFQPIPTPSEAAHRSRLYRLLCTGGVSKSEPWRETDVGEHGAMLFFKNTFARALNMPKVKALVVLSFAAYLAGAVYGCLHVQEGLDKRRLARQDSYSHHFFADQAKYFADLPYRVQIIIPGQHNYWEPEVQQQVDTLLKTFENSTYVTGSLYTDCWLREWVNFIENSRGILNVNVSTPEAWVKSLKEMLLANTDRRFKLDVVFDNETGNNIIASRCLVQTHDVRGVTEDAVMMEELRSICDNSPIKCEVFEPHFIFFDQYTYVRTITIQSTVVATIIMCIISLIFIPNPICSLWVALSIMSIEIGVIGYMSLWGVNLDSISMINLIMCIGFSVDFSAHISYAYMSAHGLSADRRVEESLYCLGLPIIQGAFSTIIGVSTLILAPSYIFEVFFKTTFLVIFFGMMHGLILLPVMLSIFGPGSLLCGAHGGHKEEDAEGAVGATQTPSYLTPGPLIMEKPEAAPEIVAVAVNVTAEINSSPGVTVSPSSPTSPSKPSAPTLTCGVTEAQRLSLALELSGDDTSSVGSAPTIPRARLVRRRSRCASAPKDTYSNAGYCSDSEGTSVSGSGSAAGGTDTGFSDATEEKSCVE